MSLGRCGAWGGLLLAALLALLLIVKQTAAFMPSCPSSSSSKLATPLRRRVGVAVRMAEGSGEDNNNNGGGKRELDRLFEEMERANTRSSVGEAIKETVDRLPLPTLPTPGSEPARPFRFPAYGFLVISALLAISFTGSLTELATGHPLFGQAATLAIIAAAGPGFIGTFVLAVQRYREEGEEDNRRLEEEERRAAQAEEKEKVVPLQGPVMMKPAEDAAAKDKEVDA